MAFEDDLIADMLAALTGKLKAGLTTTSKLAKDQARLVAESTARLIKLRTIGSLKDDDIGFEKATQRLAALNKTFVLAVIAIGVITIEQAYNAVMNVLWKALEKALGSAGLGGLLPPKLP